MSEKTFKQELILALCQNEAIVKAAVGQTVYPTSYETVSKYIQNLAEELINAE